MKPKQKDKYKQCLECGYLINPPRGFKFCNCSKRTPSKGSFPLLMIDRTTGSASGQKLNSKTSFSRETSKENPFTSSKKSSPEAQHSSLKEKKGFYEIVYRFMNVIEDKDFDVDDVREILILELKEFQEKAKADERKRILDEIEDFLKENEHKFSLDMVKGLKEIINSMRKE